MIISLLRLAPAKAAVASVQRQKWNLVPMTTGFYQKCPCDNDAMRSPAPSGIYCIGTECSVLLGRLFNPRRLSAHNLTCAMKAERILSKIGGFYSHKHMCIFLCQEMFNKTPVDAITTHAAHSSAPSPRVGLSRLLRSNTPLAVS